MPRFFTFSFFLPCKSSSLPRPLVVGVASLTSTFAGIEDSLGADGIVETFEDESSFSSTGASTLAGTSFKSGSTGAFETVCPEELEKALSWRAL